MRTYYILQPKKGHPYFFGDRNKAKGYAVSHGMTNYTVRTGKATTRR